MAAYSIRSSRDGQSVVTVRIGPAVTLAKARRIQERGWEVQIFDANSRMYDVDAFEEFVISDPRNSS